MSEPYWVPLGGAGVDYKGDWAAGTQYQPGDVVRRNGVDYLAVNPSLGTDPGVATGLTFPGQELVYVERTTNLTVTATTQAGAQEWMTLPATVFDGSPIWLECYAPYGTASQYVIAAFWEGATELGIAINFGTTLAGGAVDVGALIGRRKLTPSPGSHTYSVRAARGTGSGVLGGGAGGVGVYVPAYFRAVRA